MTVLKKKKNLRRGPDLFIKVINYSSVIVWLLIFALFIVFSMAKPSFKGFGKGFAAVSGGAWKTDYLDFIIVILVFQFIISLVGILISSSRMKRKSDTYNKSLIFFVFASAIGMLIYAVIR